MANEILFWPRMSDAWQYYSDKDLFTSLWIAYFRCAASAQINLFQADLGKSITTIFPETKHVWIKFQFDSTTLISGSTYNTDDSSIISIPYLQNGINVYSVRRYEGTDYTVGNSTIEWFTTPDSTTMWAPVVYKDEKRIANNWGVLIGEEANDSTAYRDAVAGAIYAYWNGPSKREIRNGLNIFYGQNFIERDGIVFSVDSTSLTVKHGYQDYTTYQIPDGEYPAHAAGDAVHKYDAVTNSIEVFDYITHPRWWRTYSLDMINKGFTNSTLTANQIEQINQLSKYFTFGVKIDAEKYAELDLLIPGMAIRFIDKIKPAYTNYFFIVNNNFRSINPDDTNGDWIRLDDSVADTSTGFIEEWEINLGYTFSFNYVSYLAYLAGFAASQPLTFDEYQTQAHEAYDLDADDICFWETLEIV